jgi:GNAT superfamily N-acetyltransferase
MPLTAARGGVDSILPIHLGQARFAGKVARFVPPIAYRQATGDDWPAIKAFVDRNYGADAPFKQRARWQWQMADAPFALASASRPPSWIAFEEGAVVGQISLQPTRLWIGEDPIEAGWIVDVMVDPARRGLGIGHKLYGAILSAGHVAVTLTMAEATRRIAERAGCITLPPVRQLLRVQRLSHQTLATVFAQSAAHGGRGRLLNGPVQGAPGKVLAAAIRTSARLVHGLRDRQPPAGEIAPIALPEAADIDRLFAAMRRGSGAIFDRGAASWLWRFAKAPDLHYRFAQRRIGGGVTGIVVWRLPTAAEQPVGSLVDILADPRDAETIRHLTRFANRAMAGCEAIVTGASHPAFLAALKDCGYLAVKTHRPTVSCRDPALLARIAAVGGAWHMSKADHDWDQIHAVRDH